MLARKKGKRSTIFSFKGITWQRKEIQTEKHEAVKDKKIKERTISKSSMEKFAGLRQKRTSYLTNALKIRHTKGKENMRWKERELIRTWERKRKMKLYSYILEVLHTLR